MGKSWYSCCSHHNIGHFFLSCQPPPWTCQCHLWSNTWERLVQLLHNLCFWCPDTSFRWYAPQLFIISIFSCVSSSYMWVPVIVSSCNINSYYSRSYSTVLCTAGSGDGWHFQSFTFSWCWCHWLWCHTEWQYMDVDIEVLSDGGNIQCVSHSSMPMQSPALALSSLLSMIEYATKPVLTDIAKHHNVQIVQLPLETNQEVLHTLITFHLSNGDCANSDADGCRQVITSFCIEPDILSVLTKFTFQIQILSSILHLVRLWPL